MADVVSAIGKAASDVQVVDVLNAIAPVRISEDPPFRRYVGSPARGINLLFENERVISVQIYAQGTRTFSAYSDDLPLRLHGLKNQSDVHRVLGAPKEADEISSEFALQEHGVRVVVTYDGELNIRVISISPLAK